MYMAAGEQLSEHLKKLRGSKTLIVGIGNTLKGDDGAGPLVCEQLLEAGIGAGVMDVGTAPENYVQPIVREAPEYLLVIDAIDFGASPGRIKIFEPEHLSSLVISTHVLSPRHFVEMIRQEVQVQVYFVGIQPAQTRLGEPVSADVSEAIGRIVQILVDLFPPAEQADTDEPS
jgi:hydrogenase 3 maturation protease